MIVNIYLDDIRSCPFGFNIHAFNYNECVYFLEKFVGQVGQLSLDHDLGGPDDPLATAGKEKTGYDVICWLETQHYVNNFPLPKTITVHSANPAGRLNIQRVIGKLYK